VGETIFNLVQNSFEAKFWRISMMKILILCLSSLILSSGALAAEEGLKMAIVTPGGPAPKKVEKYIGQFIGIIAGRMGIGENSVTARYFTEQKAALDYLDKNRNSFIIGSLGFYLSQRETLELIPLARVELAVGPSEHYYLVVKKGAFGELDELKGKTISGSTLYEDPRFLNRIVFNNRVDIGSDFILKPTSRPLSAIRKLLKGKLDGVLLDGIQYKSLKNLPFFDEIAVLYTSPPLPDVGLMMIDTPATRKLKERLLEALLDMGNSKEGAETFKSIGMAGFKLIDPDSLDEVIGKYEENKTKLQITNTK
jgi:ABC-type amino acid transport substrate-binding protein